MYIYVSDELRELSDIFERNGEELFIVGGYVRDSIMRDFGQVKNDVDLCSPCRPKKVAQILSGTRFGVDLHNEQFGTVIIYGEKRYEFTTFRRENFNLNGEHNPSGVEFIKDIGQDARRRDFTINAVYYNITKDQLIDPVGGVEDIKNGILKTPINSFDSFKSDGERILRMIRFACTFNFRIDEEVLNNAVELSGCVASLSKDRLRNEFNKMIECDMHYPNRKESAYAHARCMILLGQLDLFKIILPAIDDIRKSNLKDEKGELLYEHIIKTFSICPPEVRLCCLMHDVGKVYSKTTASTFEFNKDWADIIIEGNLGIDGLGYPKSQVSEIKKIVKNLDFDKRGHESKRKIKYFIRDNFDVFEKICILKDAIALENTDFTFISKIALRWRGVYNKMLLTKTPIELSQLMIDGNDIKEQMPSIKQEKIGEILHKLLDLCLLDPQLNEKNILLQKAKKIVLKRPKIYLN